MGIRFACHVCQRRLNIKRELAGRRGICPVCSARIRIPHGDTEKSTPVDASKPLDRATPTPPANAAPASDRYANSQQSAPSQQPAPSGSVAMASPDPRHDGSLSGELSTGLGSAAQLMEEPDSDALTPDDDASRVTWYVRPPSGGQYGPANTEVLKQWISEGRVASNALLWREGWPQWRDAAEALPEYAGRLPDGGASSSIADEGPGVPVIDEGEPGSAQTETGRSTRRDSDRGQRQRQETSESRGGAKVSRTLLISVLSVVALGLVLVLAVVLAR